MSIISVLVEEIRDALTERELSYKGREKLPDSAFVFPKEKRYPIHDLRHARNALARVSAFGTPAEKTKVRAAVHKRYPEIEMEKTGKQEGC